MGDNDAMAAQLTRGSITNWEPAELACVFGIALARRLFRVFLCCAGVLCVPDLTVALLGIVLALEAAGALREGG